MEEVINKIDVYNVLKDDMYCRGIVSDYSSKTRILFITKGNIHEEYNKKDTKNDHEKDNNKSLDEISIKNANELILIINTLNSLQDEIKSKNIKVITIHTLNVYIRNVLNEWIDKWVQEGFKFSLTKVTYTHGGDFKKKNEEIIEGYRPNYLLLKSIYKKSKNLDIKIEGMYDGSSDEMKSVIGESL